MASSLTVRKETDWNHMSAALLALWAIDMHYTEPSTFGYAAAVSARGHFYAHWCWETIRLVEWQSGVIGKLWFESAVSVWCMDPAIWNMNLKSQRVACNCTTSSQVKVTQNRASYKMLQKGRRKKKKPKSSVCVLTAFQVIYTEWKNCVDFMSLLGENY